jgi:CubicO group peptidase (beta-lactamase class C family)
MKYPLSRHCRVYPAREVTTTNAAAEVDPRRAALDRDDVDAIWHAVERLYATGLQPAMALTVRRRGQVIIDRAIGHVRGNAPDDPPDADKPLATPKTLFNLFSASKTVTAMLAHLLEDRRLVHLDDPVADYFPEFGRRGKRYVTIRQILTHRAGIPTLRDVAMRPELIADHDRLMELICDTEPLSVHGRQVAYHALTGGMVIGELVRRVTGQDIQQFLDDNVRKPLGFESFRFGASQADRARMAHNAFTGLLPAPPMSTIMRRALGVSVLEAVEIANDPLVLSVVVPSGNLICTADEACRFFEMLLCAGELDGVRVFERRTVRRAVAEQSWLELDTFLAFPVRYGTGFMLGGKVLSLYGFDATQAFGHIGFTNVVLWADPERDVSACFMTAGKPLTTPGQIYWWNVMRTIASRCRKIAPRPGNLGSD